MDKILVLPVRSHVGDIAVDGVGDEVVVVAAAAAGADCAGDTDRGVNWTRRQRQRRCLVRQRT